MTDPLFVADLATIKGLLRLTGVPSASVDTLAILDESILKARLSFQRRLGELRINTILATGYASNPVNGAETIRALANIVETKLVYVELLRKLPNVFMDASGGMNRIWNEEAPFRERGQTNLQDEIRRLLDEIEEDMQMLAGEESIPDETSIRTFDGTPTYRVPDMGASLRNHRFWPCGSRRNHED